MNKRYVGLAAVLAAAFVLLAALVLLERTTGVEGAVYAFLAAPMSPSLTTAAKAVTWLCNPPTVIGLCLLLLVFPPSRRTIAVPVTASAAISALLNHLLKQVFGRERPNILRLVVETSASFPSGHSMTSAAVCTTLLLLVRRHIRRGRGALSAVCVLLPLLIGVSRVYLGVHHAGDVLGGWLLGAAIGAVLYAVWEHRFADRWEQRFRR